MHRCSPGPQAPRSSRCTPHLTEPHRDPPRWVEALLSHLHFTHEEAEAERLHATQGSPAPKPGLSALDHSGGWYPLLIAPPLFSFIPGRGGGPSWETDIILLIRGRFRLGNIGLKFKPNSILFDAHKDRNQAGKRTQGKQRGRRLKAQVSHGKSHSNWK